MSDLIIRWGGARAVASLGLRLLLVLVLMVGLPLWVLWPFGDSHTPQVEVHDEAQVLQAEAVGRQLEEIGFRKEVRLAVVTLDVGYDENLNAAVLEYARAKEPGWIDDNPNYWADGLVILAVSPTGRWVGCYFGEDVKVDLATQERIQESAKSSFRAGDWAGGIEAMARTSAEIIGRPVPSETTIVLLCILGVGGGAILLGWMLWARTQARRAFKRASRHYAQVTADYDATQIRAGLIPTDDAHGAQVLARFGWFEDRYASLTRAFHDFGQPRGAGWFAVGLASRAKEMEGRASELDSMDDAIANTAALLTLSHGWQDAWANETGPVREDLASLRSLCASVKHQSSRADVEPERAWARQAGDRLSQMGAELAGGRLTPPAALDELDAISQEVRVRADALARRALEADSSSVGRTRLQRYESDYSRRSRFGSAHYAGWWILDGHRSSYNPAATIRINPDSPGAAASGVRWTGAGSSSQFSSPIEGLVTGYSAAVSYTPASTGSSGGFSGSSFSGGYSGGSFSGAGSSSHF